MIVRLNRSALYLLGLLSALRGLSLVMIADAVAGGIVSVIAGTSNWHTAAAWGLTGAVLRALVTWSQRVVAARALLGTKEKLRAELAEKLVAQGGPNVGASTTLATRGLDELDNYITVFLPALVDAAVVPLLVGVRILFADWLSAAIIVATVPLIPVFMTLIGMHTRERVTAATDALARLSEHLVELARGLPVLVGLGRAQEQTLALRNICEQYRVKTMQTLRTAFLSSLALELIATISVALVAVTIGVRLVAGGMPLEIGLLALLLAPECYTPFREIGTAFHASQDGKEALGRVRAVLETPAPQALLESGMSANSGAPSDAVRARSLRVTYAGREKPSIDNLSFTAEVGAITLLDGASGAGKSTVFAALAGSIADNADGVRIGGTVTGIDRSRLAWLPQHPHATAATALDELMIYGDGVPDAVNAAERHLMTLGLAHVADADPARLSPGELRRLAFARVLLRVDAGARLALLDEPTAHLDEASADILIAGIAALRGSVTVIIASHDAAVRALADRKVIVSADPADEPGHDAIDDVHPIHEGHPTHEVHPTHEIDSMRGGVARDTAQLSRATGAHGEAHGGSPFGTVPSGEARHPLRELGAFLRPVAGRVAAAAVLGTLATVFAIALTALSAWLIVRASEHPPIMYLLVAIVGVRFFGIGRAVLRYADRLVSHDAIFAALTTLRMRLWTGLARHGARNRALLTGVNALDRLVRDADQVRDLSIRVILPPIVGLLTVATSVVALGVIYPPSVPLFIALGVLGLVVAPAVALAADRAAARGQQMLRSRVLRGFAAMLGAAGELRANAVDGVVRRELRELDARASAFARRSAWALGMGNATIVFGCCATAVLVLPLAAAAVARGTLAPEFVAVLALTPIALIDALLDVAAAAQQWPALREVLRRVSTITSEDCDDSDAVGESRAAAPDAPVRTPNVRSIRLGGVAARWPGTAWPVFERVNAVVARGEWLVVTGRSGSGKTTLLTLLLQQLRPVTGRYLINGTDVSTFDPGALRRAFAWCPQEGHLFNSTLRANLLLARDRSDAPADAELRAVLHRVGLGPLLERLAHGLDTPIGPAGSYLSGGERQRVAVARTLLTRADVILIDEPTAHLDEESAELLMADLRFALREKITVLVTHQPIGVRAGDIRVHLDADRVGADRLETAPA
ncbi:MAG TPA: thiol reductant ABC exporter subunit CydD [Microbacteriaceae bacterium]